MDSYAVRATVELFPQLGGWHYVSIPPEITEELRGFAQRGLVPIRATVGSTSWDTSLLPKGDGTQFIALSKKVRGKEDLAEGDMVDVTFTLRTEPS